MSNLSSELRFAVNDELALLLALNRESEITPAQMQRLDLLLERRGQQIEARSPKPEARSPKPEALRQALHQQQCAA